MENLGLVNLRYVIHYVLLLDNLLDGGLDCGVIYIDTEGIFRPERVEQIARARGLDTYTSISVCKVYNSSHLELIVKDLGRYINEFKAKLVIIDSIISLHRAEFAGK